MKYPSLLPIIGWIVLLALFPGGLDAANPVVSNITATQRAGTKLVDITYDETADKLPQGLTRSDWSGIRAEYERHRHTIVANSDGTHQARNPGQAWMTKFDSRGFTVSPDAGDWSWGLELKDYGPADEARQDGARISFARGDGLTEWFVNDTRGLEQGWTLARRPRRAVGNGPLELRLATRGGLNPQVSSEGCSVAFMNESGCAVLTYGSLKAWDADGMAVPVHFTQGDDATSGIGVVVDDANARYPITIDPLAQQQAYLKASNAEAHDEFCSVAVSGDTIVVGATGEASSAKGINGNQSDNSASGSGAAYVFVRNGTTWSQQAYLKASNAEAGDQFGSSVAISGDTIVVGSYAEDSSAKGINGNQSNNFAITSGAAYVFVRNGITWSQQAYLKASNAEADDFFGSSVAISGDTIVVGSSLEDSSATGVNGNQSDNSASGAGAAYVFVRNGTTWSQQSYLKASNAEAGDQFGSCVAISAETMVVGATGEDSNTMGVNGNQSDNSASGSGAAYVFNLGMYTLLASANNGAVQGSGIYGPDSVATLTATPNPGYIFTGWTGDASGSTNPLNLTMDTDKTVGATFAMDLTDADADGITAYDELVVYGTNPNLADSDGDGLSDGWEVGIGRFSIVPGAFTWQQARDDAHAKGGELACFPTEDRWQRAVQSLGINPFETFTGLWIGASDSVVDGTWVWVNGQAFSYAPWGTTRPSTTAGNTLDYLEVSGGAGAEIGKWYDRSASTVRDGYIFETGYATSPTLSDTDGDGFSDGVEIAAKLNPLLASSTPEGNATVSLKSQAGLSNLEFRFNAANGASYRIEGSTDLQNWNIVEDGIIGQGGVVTRFYSTENHPKRYFRVRRN